jgi:hypothetical protein
VSTVDLLTPVDGDSRQDSLKDSPKDSPQPSSDGGARPGDTRSGGRGMGRLPELSVVMAFGVLLVALAFAGSRSQHPWATPVYWAGIAVVFVAPTALLLGRKTVTRVEGTGIAVLVPVLSFVIMQCYSPGQFRFLDEFDHMQTAQTILATGHLFHVNTILPQSSQYPGLEIVTTALVELGHLSITTAGIIATGVAHVLEGVALFILALTVTRSPRISALTVVVYATAPHYLFFDSYFIYETMAIPLLLLTVLAAVRALGRTGWSALEWGGVAVVFGAATAVTHHVTSYAMAGLLLCLVVGTLIRPPAPPGSRRSAIVPAGVLVVAVAIVGWWDLGVAHTTVSYFTPVVDSFGHGIGVALGLTTKASTHSSAGPAGPVVERMTEYFALLLLMALVALGAWLVWRRPRWARNPPVLGLAIAALAIIAVPVTRLLIANGSEFAGRAMTFVLIPASVVIAIALADLPLIRLPHIVAFGRNSLGRAPAAWLGTGVVLLVAIGGIAAGWPPFYARMPGSYKAAAWERSVDQHNLAASQWANDVLPPDYGIASDYFTATLMAAIGHQAQVNGVSSLFLDPRYTTAQRALVRSKEVTFVVIDKRITEQLPAAGYYFTADPKSGSYASPVPRTVLTKFEEVAGASRVFDDGTIFIYDLTGTAHH